MWKHLITLSCGIALGVLVDRVVQYIKVNRKINEKVVLFILIYTRNSIINYVENKNERKRLWRYQQKLKYVVQKSTT